MTMPYETSKTPSHLNRRTALGGIGAAATSIGVGRVNRATAQEATPDSLANHPLVGTWAVMTTGGIVPQTHHPDGAFIAAFPPNYVDPATGLTFQGSGLGRWEPTGARSGRFTFLQALADPEGTYRGTFQLSAEIDLSEDGQSWAGTAAPRIVVRDPGNTVVFDEVVALGPPVMATRMSASSDGFALPDVRPVEATPTS
jgi:hypothetical protein